MVKQKELEKAYGVEKGKGKERFGKGGRIENRNPNVIREES